MPEKVFPIVKLQFSHKVLIGLQRFFFFLTSLTHFSFLIFFRFVLSLKEQKSQQIPLLFLGFSKWVNDI